jgi:hypothetical protein
MAWMQRLQRRRIELAVIRAGTDRFSRWGRELALTAPLDCRWGQSQEVAASATERSGGVSEPADDAGMRIRIGVCWAEGEWGCPVRQAECATGWDSQPAGIRGWAQGGAASIASGKLGATQLWMDCETPLRGPTRGRAIAGEFGSSKSPTTNPEDFAAKNRLSGKEHVESDGTWLASAPGIWQNTGRVRCSEILSGRSVRVLCDWPSSRTGESEIWCRPTASRAVCLGGTFVWAVMTRTCPGCVARCLSVGGSPKTGAAVAISIGKF